MRREKIFLSGPVKPALPGAPRGKDLVDAVQDTFFSAAPCGSDKQTLWPVPGDAVQHDVRRDVLDTCDEKLAVVLHFKYRKRAGRVLCGEGGARENMEKLEL